MEKPEGEPTRDEIIDTYIKTLSKVLGSDEKARMRIYSVSTRCYYAFGALVSEELSYKIEKLPGVRWVLPDSYLDEENKDYGGEPFINGKAVPYDPQYHEQWILNNNKRCARERDRQHNPSPGGDVQPNTGGMQHNAHAQNDMGGTPAPNANLGSGLTPNVRYYNNDMPNNDGGECRHAPKQNGGMSFQGGTSEDFNSNGNYQLGRETIADN
ncbi:multiple organellar RNA editing factor 8, chloroplastic/mitochondrial-like [Papaver somniferum]|uniref:multiple organellar RNA editing factor 8, chloroplastic/mitochondrial-like n=1 Tax=Papaver somniferum TaxID=3469 RepID=UPI000E704763|nr:multiple organellar RNA editing factor 8, chloroplastic/mitochondrial-like [Papaver somniferum]